MQSTTHLREGWSRRHFLLLGLTVPAWHAMPALARGRPSPKPSDAAASALIVVSAELLTATLRNHGLHVLAGERLARFNATRQLLQGRPHRVQLHLDATDRLLWDVALAEAGITHVAIDGETTRLVHHRSGGATPFKEARA